ncbi:MAG: DNA repair protein RecO [Acholeplasmatales bacterium]|nr:MAG: DNA repair protein RecO [Acholeplasmatales bacterium]
MEPLTEVYILRTLDYRESSRLLFLYGKQGVQSALARGVKKLDAPHRHLAQTGHLVEVALSTSRLPTVKTMQRIELYQPLKQSLLAQTVSQVAQELIYYNTTDTDDHLKLFGFLKKWLKQLEHHAAHPFAPIELLLVFELKFFYLLGYGIRFTSCHVCGIDKPLYFEPKTAMVACADHVERLDEACDETQFALLKWALHLDVTTYTPKSTSFELLHPLMQLVNGLHSMFLGHVPKARTILQTLL